MRNITINIPDAYIKLLEKLGNERNASRSELIRRAIKEHLEKDLAFYSAILKLSPELELELKKRKELQNQRRLQIKLKLEKEKIKKFFNFCVLCDRRLHTKETENYYRFRNLDIFELKFCCSCYKKYEGKPLIELPEPLLEKIQEKLKEFKKFSD